MKQINPLYVMALLVLILLFVIVRLTSATSAQNEAIASLEKTEKMAKRITTLKRTWEKPTATKKAIARLMKSSVLRGAAVKQKHSKGGLSLKATALNRHQMEYLIGKLFNGSFTIKSYEIKRLSEEKASLNMEISL